MVKSRTMAGFDAPYVPGYDCHGLPIELKVDRELGPKKREMSVADFRRACRAYAERFIDVMTEEFQRLGVFGDWDHPYLTMDFKYQAAIARALGKFVEQGLVYKGKKPVHWCIHCRTALAEAEVEYEDHTSPSIYVEFPLAPDSAERAGGARPGAGRTRRLGPDLDDDAVDDPVEPGDRLPPGVRLRRLRGRRPRRDRRRGAGADGRARRRPDVRRAGRADEGRGAGAHPLPASALRARLARRARRLRHARGGHRRRAHRPGPRRATTSTPACSTGSRSTRRSGRADTSSRPSSCSAASGCSTPTRTIEEALKERGRLWHRAGLPALVSALLALPQPGDLPGDVAVVHPRWTASRSSARPADTDRRATTLRAGGARGDRSRREVDPGVGPRPHLQHAGEPARLVHLAPARLGRADSGGRLHEVRRGAPDARRWSSARRRCSTTTAPTPGTSGRSRSSSPPGSTCPSCGGTEFERERDILDVWFDSGSSHEAVLPFRRELTLAGRHVSRGQRPASRLVPELAARRPRHARPAAVPRGR